MLVWMDLEMTGLEPERHVILEIATIVTDDDLQIVAEGPDLVLAATPEQLGEMDDVVLRMHTESGLLVAVQESTLGLEQAGAETLAFIDAHVPDSRKVPLCGDFIGVDRRFLHCYLPEVENALHYRSVDVSTVKELCKRWFPSVYGKAPKKAGSHRALGDIRESVAESADHREQLFRPPTGAAASATAENGSPAG